jgi:hypothetical protein
MTTFVVVEGSERRITLPDEIAANDAAVIEALRPFYPEVGEAEITRETDAEQNTIVKVVPQGKTKGYTGRPVSIALTALARAPRHVNRAVELCLALEAGGEPTAEQLLASAPAIEQAIREAYDDLRSVEEAFHRLSGAPGVPAESVPLGF